MKPNTNLPTAKQLEAAAVNSVIKHNNDLRKKLAFMDKQTAVIGKFTTERDDDGWVIYGFEDLRVWDPNLKVYVHLHPTNPDKFKVLAEDYDTAKSEFWARWNIYCSKMFKFTVSIENN